MQDTGEQQERKHNLHGHGETPLDRGVDVGEAEIDPVGDHSTESDDGTFQVDQEPSVFGLGHFRLPHGDGGGVETGTNAGDDSADDELAETPVGAEGRGGDDGTDDGGDGAQDDKWLSADVFTSEHDEQRAEKTPDFVAGGDSALDDGGVSVVVAELLGGRELVVELVTGDEPGHEPLVVAEERETGDGGDGDGETQVAPAKPGGVCSVDETELS